MHPKHNDSTSRMGSANGLYSMRDCSSIHKKIQLSHHIFGNMHWLLRTCHLHIFRIRKIEENHQGHSPQKSINSHLREKRFYNFIQKIGDFGPTEVASRKFS